MSVHLDRKELKRPDAFVTQGKEAIHWVEEHIKSIIVFVIVLIGLIAAVLAFRNLQAQKAEQAADAAYLAKKNLFMAEEKLAKDPNWEQKVSGEISQVEKVAKDSVGTYASYEAYLDLGNLYFNHGSFEKAADYYSRGAESAAVTVLKLGALELKATALENAKKYDDAAAALHQILDSKNQAFRSGALMSLGRVYSLKGDKTKAVEQYALVIQEYPNTPIAKSAEAFRAGEGKGQ
jgi:tetratricopeptide (TPR) repeat protein